MSIYGRFIYPVLRRVLIFLGCNSTYGDFWLLVWIHVLVNGIMFYIGYKY